MQGIDVADDIYAHVAGVDVVRADAGEFYVLEDNLRVPRACRTCSRTAR